MEFVRDWRDAPGYEEGDAAPFVIKLFQVFGVDKAVAGVFELQARRASRNYAHGRIDALTDDVIIEMKSAGKDLVEAEQQAIDYLPSLPKLGIKVPRFILTSDFKKFRLLDTHSPHEPAFEFTLDELPNEIERLQFLAGYEPPKLSTAQQEDASIKAAKIMGGLYRVLESSG
ncbi:MAG: class I SAM-dependent DNA methyltransferase, partial [Archangium gephyra]